MSKPRLPTSNASARSVLSPSPSTRDWNLGERGEEQGRPLEDGLRRPMENFFQRPLAGVRVFSGPGSDRAVESLGAYALTHGQDIHLGGRGRSLPAPQQRGLFDGL